MITRGVGRHIHTGSENKGPHVSANKRSCVDEKATGSAWSQN